MSFLRSAEKTGGVRRVAVLGLILNEMTKFEHTESREGTAILRDETHLHADGVGSDSVALEALQGLQEVLGICSVAILGMLPAGGRK